MLGSADGIRSIEATMGGPGRVILDEGSQEWPGLSQENRAQPPSSDDSVQNTTGVPQQRTSLPNRKLVHHGRDPAMFAGPADVAVVPSQVVWVHRAPVTSPEKTEPGHDSVSARLCAQVQVDWNVSPWEYLWITSVCIE